MSNKSQTNTYCNKKTAKAEIYTKRNFKVYRRTNK